MSDEEDSDGEAGLPSWVFWMIGGLIVFGVGFGSLGQMVGLWLGVLGMLSSLVLGVVGWVAWAEGVEARQWFLTAGMFALSIGGILGGLRISNELACYRAKQVAEALTEYRADHGEYPDKLGALSPEYVRWPYLGGFSTTHTLWWNEPRVEWGMECVEVGTGECGPVPGSPLPPEMRQDIQQQDGPEIDY